MYSKRTLYVVYRYIVAQMIDTNCCFMDNNDLPLYQPLITANNLDNECEYV